MGTAIKDFKVKKAYAELIRKKLQSYLWEGIYKPLFDIANFKPKKAKNSDDPLLNALEKGNIYYENGGFKAKNKFTNAQSLALEKIGAKWESWHKMYKLAKDLIPTKYLVAIATAQLAAQAQLQDMDKFLQEVLNNFQYVVETMAFHDEVVTILDDAGNEIKKNVKHLNVIVPELTREQKREIARSYTNNVTGYVIADFKEERIPFMRKQIQKMALEGARYEDVQKFLQREYNFEANKAKFLAFNETNIMLAEYKKVEYKEMGFTKFIWQTRADSKVRSWHQHLNGTVWDFDNPPIIDPRTQQKGLPGETYNCRCEMIIYSDNNELEHKYIKRNKETGSRTSAEAFTPRQSKKRMEHFLEQYQKAKKQ